MENEERSGAIVTINEPPLPNSCPVWMILFFFTQNLTTIPRKSKCDFGKEGTGREEWGMGGANREIKLAYHMIRLDKMMYNSPIKSDNLHRTYFCDNKKNNRAEKIFSSE